MADGACLVHERRMSLTRLAGLFGELRAEAGLPDAALAQMEDRLLDHLSLAMRRYSGLLEFSASREDAATSPYRFSYSLRGLERTHGATERQAMTELFRPFGESVGEQAQALAARSDLEWIHLVLMGIDARPTGLRYKVYYQFPPGLLREKLMFLRSFLDKETLRETPEPYERLHLVGVDFDDSGLHRIKLYFLHPHIPRHAILERFPEQPLLRALLDGPCPQGLLDFLTIRRVGVAGTEEAPAVAELDFGLVANDLVMDDLLERDPQLPGSGLFSLWKRLSAAHRLVPTRVSLRPGDMTKLNLYYVALDPLPGRA